MKTAAKILLGLLSLLYPLLWYYGRGQGWFYPLAGLMLLLWLARAAMQRDPAQKRLSLLIAAFFAATLLFRRSDSMYWYPVWVNGLLLFLFGLSLTQKQSAVERLARLQHPDLPPEGVAYTRRVTQIWCAFFALNGGTAALLALLGQHRWWALYTGIIAYILMGILMGGEFAYRKWVLKL
ncbi:MULTISPECIES: hypothetical protein [Eikenella]|uniref:DNA gyrase subunit B n=1 Tax=Eikenella longinqua TaxID=1795827 RepID=A0A1A9S3G7_9NEIS|nr:MULTISPECIES: hypothetical protein [Eikenella]OAM31506.1 hypothetical protein A7P95_00290 [Eikenella longinqua]